MYNKPLAPKIDQSYLSNLSNNTMRGIISPCAFCKNNIPVPKTPEEWEKMYTMEIDQGWACPKKRLYATKELIQIEGGAADKNLNHPAYDPKLKGKNPVWPGEGNNNPYAYVYIATFEDNIDNGFNPNFDTERIRCRGPFLINQPERYWNFLGHLEYLDTVLVHLHSQYLDGIQILGYVTESSVWQTAKGYLREIDKNLGVSFSGT